MTEDTWTAELVGTLRELWGEGHSGSEIARRLAGRFGVPMSSSAVVGKARRLGLPGRPSPIKQRPAASGTGRGCRFPLWPHGAQPTGEYCGKRISRDSYCAEHFARTHVRVSVTGRVVRDEDGAAPAVQGTPS